MGSRLILLFGQASTLLWGVVQGPDGALPLGGHEADDGDEGRPDWGGKHRQARRLAQTPAIAPPRGISAAHSRPKTTRHLQVLKHLTTQRLRYVPLIKK